MKEDFIQELKNVRSSRTDAKLVRPIVPIEKWLYDEYYLGPDAGSIYPFWRDHIIKIFNSKEYIDTVIITGSIGTGKTTIANLILMRKLYELSCYDNIQSLFNLMLSSKLAFTYFNITKDQAEATGYGQLKEMIDASPYFREHFCRNMNKSSDIEWPNSRLAIGYASNTGHIVGANLLGSVLDEANFYQGDGKESVGGTVQSKASKIFTNIKNRGRSRFLRNGINMSLSIVVSSSMYSNSFSSKLIKDSSNDPHTYIIDGKIWDVKPEGTYSKDKFYVFQGNESVDPFICNSIADVSNVLEVLGYRRQDNMSIDDAINTITDVSKRLLFISVPVDFRQSFETNIVSALQDIAGVSVAPIGRLFQSRSHYQAAIDDNIEHPLLMSEIVLSTKSSVSWADLFKVNFEFKDKEKPRYIHFDQSLSGDSAGVASCYIDSVEEVNGASIPHITVDFMVRVVPPKAPAQTDIGKMRSLVYHLESKCGLNIGKVTYDMIASAESIQVLQSQGYEVEHQSVDRTDEAYVAMCNLFYEYRIKLYRYKPYEDELFNLIHFRQQRKVDHPDNGSKDVTDGVAGAIFNALTSKSVESTLRQNDVGAYIEFM